jgi:ABC-type spermidine/putrescine transport system permease subunit II
MSATEVLGRAAGPTRAARAPRGRGLRWLLALGFFAVASVVLVIPLIVGVLWSFVNPEDGWFPPAIVPPSLSLANWHAMLAVPEIGQAFAKSFLIAPIVTLLCSAMALPTGYALGRRHLRARRTIELLILAPIILPGIVLATGLGSMFIRMGLSHTVTGVVLVQTVVLLPFMIRIVAATFEGVPQDLIDAARNLGAGPWALTRHVLIPMVKPGLFAGGLFTFIGSLEEFVLTFIVGMPHVQTLPVLLWAYLGGRSSIFTYAAVVTMVLLAPTILLMFIAERALKQEYLAAGFGKV